LVRDDAGTSRNALSTVVGYASEGCTQRRRAVTPEQPWRQRFSPPGVVAVISLCLCFPVGLLLIWALPVHRGDGSKWSIGWKVAYSLAYIVPLAGFITYFQSQHMSGGTSFVSIPIVGCVICVAIADGVYHAFK